jgi:glyoxylase-like metal-dependent hydrolase (beta-lactamase superfamily II)/rhodanese-related sulfurtransferase
VYFRQILHEDLGCASYLVADGGEAAVLDPKWQIDEYLRLSEQAGAAIRHVLETHTHADHVSGRTRLAAATGAEIHLPAEPGSNGRGLRDGDEIRLGEVTLRAVAAPGHRPEHLAYLLLDRDQPRALLSGDSLLVGDVARPDLAVPSDEGAHALFDTLRRFDALEDRVELWPAHVGGSLCGSGSLSSETSSTLGDQRRTNPLLSVATPDQFAAQLTRSIPPRPPTVERVVGLNEGAQSLPPELRELDAGAVARLVSSGGCVLDVRTPQEFDAGHVAGAINLPAALKGLGTRAGWAVGPDEPLALVATTHADARAVASLLHAAGLWNVQGTTLAEPEGWSAAGLEVRTAGALEPEEVVPRLSAGQVRLLDVRDLDEWREGHVDPSLHLPPAVMADGNGLSLSAAEPLAVACAAGNRAALSASVLRRRGYSNVLRVLGGVQDVAHHGARWVNGS